MITSLFFDNPSPVDFLTAWIPDLTLFGLSIFDLLWVTVALLAIMAFVGANAMVLVYAERKIAGFIQRRQGPYELGPQGVFQ